MSTKRYNYKLFGSYIMFNYWSRAAIRSICYLAIEPRFCNEIVDIGALPAIISCLYSSDDEILQQSIILVSQLLVIEETRKQLVKSQNMSLLITQVMEQCRLFSQQPQQQHQGQQQPSLQQQKQLVLACIKILDVLTSSEEGALEIASGTRKGISTLVSLISSSNDPSFSNPIFSLLTKLSNNKKCISYFTDFIRWTVSLLRSSDPGVVRCAIYIIGNLMEHTSHKTSFRTCSGISLLVVLLRDPSLIHLRANILAIISSLSSDSMNIYLFASFIRFIHFFLSSIMCH